MSENASEPGSDISSNMSAISAHDEESQSEDDQKPQARTVSFSIAKFPNMQEISTDNSNILPVSELTAEDELWLIIAPKDYSIQKQNVDMENRQELKDGQFEIQFFNHSDSGQNLVSLVSEDSRIVTGPSFVGCCQISENTRSFAPQYLSSVSKNIPFPEGLKNRYIPFGADINNDENIKKVNKAKHKTKRKRHEENEEKEIVERDEFTTPPKKKKRKNK